MSTHTLKIAGHLDRYVAWLFVRSYAAAFLLVVGIFLIMKMATQLDDLLRPAVTGDELEPGALDVVRYYVLNIPFLYLEMSPFVTLVAGLFTATRMMRANEVVAALGAGVSLRRLFTPLYLGAVVLAGGMFVLREWATEELGARRALLEFRLTERRAWPVHEYFTLRDARRRAVRIDAFHVGDAAAGGPWIEGLTSHFQTPDGTVSVRADRAWPVAPFAEGRWRVEGGRKVVTGARQMAGPIHELEDLRFTPGDVAVAWKGQHHALELSFSESLRLLERDPDRPRYRTLFHYHLTFPLAGLVLLAVGLPFALGQERGRTAERVAVGLLLCVVYFGFDFVTRTLGLQGHLGPLHAAWLPVVTFGSLGVVLSGTMRS